MSETPKKILIKYGTIINHDYTVQADVLIENGKVVEIKNNIEDSAAECINATGCFVMPGGVDAETYFSAERGKQRSPETYFTGTKAAIYGGNTTVINCLEIVKDQSLKEKYEEEKELASKEIVCNLAFQMCLPDLNDSTKTQFKDLIESKSVVPIVRLSTVDKGCHCVKINDDDLYDALCWCRDNSVLPTIHAENDKVIASLEQQLLSSGITGPEGHYLSRTEQVEEEAIYRVLTIADLAKCPIHLGKVYCSQALGRIMNWKQKSSNTIVCGTSIAAIVHNAEKYRDPDWKVAASFVTIPALKMNKIIDSQCTSLLEMVANRNIDHVASSHLVFEMKHKASGKNDFRCIIPGTNGVQYRMKILWDKAVKTGRLEPTTFVNCVSTTPAKLANLYPQKGSISVGSDADIVIWSGDSVSHNHYEAGDINIFENITTTSGPRCVIINGEVVLDLHGNFCGGMGTGQIISPANESSNPYFQKHLINHRLANEMEVKIERDPYDGPVVDPKKDDKEEIHVLYSHMVNTDVYKRGGPKEERKEALPPGQRLIKTSVKTAQPPGGSSQASWWG